MKTALAVLALIVAMPAVAAPPDIDLMLTQDHRSNALRRGSTTEDYLGVGATIRWRTVELDLSHGVVSRDCTAFRDCLFEPGSRVTTRWYPTRGRAR